MGDKNKKQRNKEINYAHKKEKVESPGKELNEIKVSSMSDK